MDKTTEQILNDLTGVKSKLQLIVDSKEIDSQEILARDWLSYDEALTQIQQAIASLEKLNVSTASSEPLTASQPKKNLLARLREIQLDGEPDWSQRHGEIL